MAPTKRADTHERLPHGERYLYADEPIEINVGRRKTTLTVRNTGDRAIQVCSHYHFFEANRALAFDRDAAFGMHLDLPAGTAVRLEPGDTHEVPLVEYGGGMRLMGFSGLVNGGIHSERTHALALMKLRAFGFIDTGEGMTPVAVAPAERPGIPAKAAKPAKPAKPAKAAKAAEAPGKPKRATKPRTAKKGES
ncbi:urease subunit beta [Microtetraspora malaysiensis]|uniref:urease subunit beta n=1 Tax=Microtetraspora malaysiensis TaxID=161358 RepID=UPI0009FDA000|nr:urease subunit beta [Microtetraspora malaysiensis]